MFCFVQAWTAIWAAQSRLSSLHSHLISSHGEQYFKKKKKKKVIWAHWRFTLQISALFECHHGGQRWPRTPPEIDSDVRGVGLAGVPLSAEGSLELRSPSTSAGLKDKVQGQSGRRVRWCMGLLIVCF